MKYGCEIILHPSFGIKRKPRLLSMPDCSFCSSLIVCALVWRRQYFLSYIFCIDYINEPSHDKTNKMICAPSLISLRSALSG